MRSEKSVQYTRYTINCIHQIFHSFPQPITVRAGDELKTICTYDSTKRRKTTLGGDSTSDEMCIAFIKFYPKQAVPMPLCMNYKELSICKSAPQYKDSFPDRLEGCDVMEFAHFTNPVVLDIVFTVWFCSHYYLFFTIKPIIVHQNAMKFQICRCTAYIFPLNQCMF